MFKKKFRLPPDKLKPEKSFTSSLFVLKIAQNEKKGPRFGIVVSKNISKKAVSRNKIKRMFRRSIEENLNENDNRDFLFIVKKEPRNFEELDNEIKINL